MKYLILIISAVFVWSCSTTKQTTAVVSPEVEEEFLDTMHIVADAVETEPMADIGDEMEMANDLPVYRASFKRTVDILHTKLDLKFDIPKEKVIGIASLTIQPISRPIQEIVLDAKNFTINSIKDDHRHELKYIYDNKKITIQLNHKLGLNQQQNIVIDYISYPGSGELGGSQAITSDKGLFFIDPKGEDPTKPTQIWTQGETESNSRWFPTVDKPNERCTQEIYVTVDNEYETLSNGTLISSNNNSDGTRTDYWKMDIPHAPYLFMLTIGDFAVVKETWRGKELSYYVEPEYSESAKDIFNNTPEMLTFFSDLFGVEYPWPKLGQVVVRDYVSGAMENTTGIIYGDFIQHHKRNLIDNHNDRIVAHEIIHHWFGDMVTCESWSNLTMNEGFANYGEYLWFEHKYGRDAADYHRMNEQAGYLNSTLQAGIRDLIDFDYNSREEMFDAHSYNKGGLVLHQLRSYLGDDAFFKGLNIYLKDNAYTAVEAHDLRLAMEEASGEDLNWFWNQWFYSAGHPSLEVTKNYSETAKSLTLTFAQNQEAQGGQPSIFQLPLAVDIYQAGQSVRREHLMINQRNQQFVFDVSSKPELVNVDATHSHIGYMVYEKSDDEYVYQFKNAPLFNDRLEALQELGLSSHPAKQQIAEKALDDPYWFIRNVALDQILLVDNPALLKKVKEMALKDERSNIRAKALGLISGQNDIGDAGLFEKVIENEMAYPVIGAALSSLNVVDSKKALNHAMRLEATGDESFVEPIAQVYSSIGSAEYLPFFQKHATNSAGIKSFGFLNHFAAFAAKLPATNLKEQVGFVTDMALGSDGDMWKKLALFKTLNDIKNLIGGNSNMSAITNLISTNISKLSDTETNSVLKNYYGQFQQ